MGTSGDKTPRFENPRLHRKARPSFSEVVTALLAVEDSGIAYCESLLVPPLLSQGPERFRISGWVGSGSSSGVAAHLGI